MLGMPLASPGLLDSAASVTSSKESWPDSAFVGLLWQVGTVLALMFLAEAAHGMAGAPAG